MRLVKAIYADAEVARIPLDSAKDLKDIKATLRSIKLWIDPGVDGFHSFGTRSPNSSWHRFLANVPAFNRIGSDSFQSNPDIGLLTAFVNELLDRCSEHKPDWITVPQLPSVSDSSRNKINRELAKATGKWKSSHRSSSLFVLPLVLTHQDQTKGKTQRNPKVQLAERCYYEAQADGLWVVDTTLTEESGSEALRGKRFKAIIDLHQELNEKIHSKVRVAGPYWGLNLVLWARGLVDYPAVGIGATYQYYLPGGHSNPPTARVAIAPLRRRVGVAKLKAWFVEALNLLSPMHPAYSQLAKIQKDLSLLADPDRAREQVAKFYKVWFDSLAGTPQAGRALALFQDLAAAFALGKSLPKFPNEGPTRKAESVVEPLMVNCL